MPSIRIEKLETYNHLIRSNRYGTRNLEKHCDFPLVSFDIVIPPLTKKEYSNLVDWSGEKNAMYFSKCLSEFYKHWLLLPTKILPEASFDKKNKRDRLILDIADCFETQEVNVNTMDFFQKLKEEPYTQNIEGKKSADIFEQLKKFYGRMSLPMSRIGLSKDRNLELYLLENKIEIR